MTERIQRFPFFLIFLCYISYLSYQLYSFHLAPDGEIETHKMRVHSLQSEMQIQKKKLAEGQKFVQSLDTKRRDIQEQVRKLEEFQGSMSENLDVPAMIKMIVTEARRSMVKVDKIEPGKKTLKEYYLEQEFKLDVHGSYSQVVQFFQRISQLQRILRIESFSLKPQSSLSTLRNTILDSQLSVRSYQYVIGKEDKIGKGETR